MSRICPACQAPVSPRSRFCPRCGHDLPAATETSATPLPPTRQTAITAATQHSPAETSAGMATVGPAPLPTPPTAPAFREEIQAPYASFTSAPLPLSTHPLEEPLARTEPLPPLPSELCPLKLELNFLHVLVAGHSTTLQLRVRNEQVLPLEQLQLYLESRGLSSPLSTGWRRVAAAQQATNTLEIDPERSGNFVLQVAASWESGGQRFSYRGQRTLKVLQRPETGNISVSIGDIQGNTGSGANQGLGAEYGDVNISNLLSGIRTLNDLIELDLPEKFHSIPLELDFELSQGAFDLQSRDAGRALRIPPAFLAAARPGATCALEASDGSEQIMPFRLIARAQFRFGRARADSDFVAWRLPRNEANDERSKRVSKVHAIAEISAGSLIVRDNTSTGGTLLDGQKLEGMGGATLGSRGRLALGGAVEIDLARFDSARAGDPPISNLRSWSGPTGTPPSLRGAVRCEVQADERQPLNAVWILSDAAFGSSRSNAIVLDWGDLAEIQGRFHTFRGCFWIENINEAGLVRIDHHTLAAGEIAPLTTGQQLRLGARTFRVNIQG